MQPTTQAANTTSAATAPITSALRNFYGNLAGTPSSQQAEGDINEFNKLNPSTGSILSEFDKIYGVNERADRVGNLRKSVMNAEDLVNNVENNVFSRTSNALVSDAQRARLTAAEKDPLLKQLDIENRNFDLASQDLASAREQSNRFSGAEISDINTMRSSLSERLGTSQQREAVERERLRQEEENRQWWANYDQQRAQFEKDLALRTRSLDAQIAQSRASTNNLLASLNRNTPAAVTQTIQPQVHYGSNGQSLGYTDNLGRTTLTDAGKADQERYLKDQSRGVYSNNFFTSTRAKALGGLGDITGWW